VKKRSLIDAKIKILCRLALEKMREREAECRADVKYIRGEIASGQHMLDRNGDGARWSENIAEHRKHMESELRRLRKIRSEIAILNS
jgi:hypothetical protein